MWRWSKAEKDSEASRVLKMLQKLGYETVGAELRAWSMGMETRRKI